MASRGFSLPAFSKAAAAASSFLSPYNSSRVGVLDVGDRRVRRQLQRGLDVRLRFGGFRAVGQAADHRADLVDDLGVIERQRGMRLGMPGRQFQGRVQRLAHLAGNALLERLDDAQALAVTAEREGMAVMAVGFVRQRLECGLGQLGGLFEALELLVLVVDQIGRMDAQRLDRDRGAERAECPGRPRRRPGNRRDGRPARLPAARSASAAASLAPWRPCRPRRSTPAHACCRGRARHRRRAAPARPSSRRAPVAERLGVQWKRCPFRLLARHADSLP